MALATQPSQRAAKPTIKSLIDDPRLHNYKRAGGTWTPDAALALTIDRLIVHWDEKHCPQGLSQEQAIARALGIAYFHMYERDWDEDMPGVQGSDGIQYHYYIVGQWILQVTAETKRLWHATKANPHSIAICLAGGTGDAPDPATVKSLSALLAWFCTGRAELPLVTSDLRPVTLYDHAGTKRVYASHGILTHDESRSLEGLPPKGCCGVYKPYVSQWRTQYKGVI